VNNIHTVDEVRNPFAIGYDDRLDFLANQLVDDDSGDELMMTPVAPRPTAPPHSRTRNTRSVHFESSGNPRVADPDPSDDEPPVTPEPPEMV
jgi:hypothetical protein